MTSGSASSICFSVGPDPLVAGGNAGTAGSGTGAEPLKTRERGDLTLHGSATAGADLSDSRHDEATR